jgi:putative transposase
MRVAEAQQLRCREVELDMPRYRHWLNTGQGGDTVFFTTKVLDFAHVFARDEIKDLVTASLLDDCDYYGVALNGFVVLSNHVHWLATLREDQPATDCARDFKRNWTDRIAPKLTSEELKLVGHQVGLNRHSLLERGFKGIQMMRKAMYLGKLEYMHLNPVRAGVCGSPEDYRWSSARAFLAGEAATFYDLDIAKLIGLYHPERLPWPRKAKRWDGSERSF